MCTAISVKNKDHYFGRNLDYHCDFGERITITPRNYRFNFINGRTCNSHYAIIGSALPNKNYPLYFDATNEMGLSVAGLNFPEFTHYNDKLPGKTNVASFEFIPWVLTGCATVDEVCNLLKNTNITNQCFDENMAPTPLHWLIADKDSAITVEQTKNGIQVYKNKLGALTNSPGFDMQMLNLSNYVTLSPEWSNDGYLSEIDILSYGKGIGAVGLPGDCSPMSRFVRAGFNKMNCEFGKTENESVSSFFHLLNSVYHIKGCVRENDELQMTHYSSCCNTTKGIYYYTTYFNSEINAVDMHKENLDTDELIIYDFIKDVKINVQN